MTFLFFFRLLAVSFFFQRCVIMELMCMKDKHIFFSTCMISANGHFTISIFFPLAWIARSTNCLARKLTSLIFFSVFFFFFVSQFTLIFSVYWHYCTLASEKLFSLLIKITFIFRKFVDTWATTHQKLIFECNNDSLMTFEPIIWHLWLKINSFTKNHVIKLFPNSYYCLKHNSSVFHPAFYGRILKNGVNTESIWLDVYRGISTEPYFDWHSIIYHKHTK